MPRFKPFQEEASSLLLDQLTVENRVDRIELYGTLQITRDQAGLQTAYALKALIDAAVAVLESEDLPKQVVIRPPDETDNPFS